MALYRVSSGGIVNATDPDQLVDLLTGVMTDQPVTIANRVRANLSGATSGSGGYVGATASGPPTSGTFNSGDWIVATDGTLWICTAGGTPGTWAFVAGQDKYKCHLYQSSGTSCPTGAWTPVGFDSEFTDPLIWHDTVTNNSRITPTVACTLVCAYTVGSGTTAGWATAFIGKNGSDPGSVAPYGATQSPGPIGGTWGLTGIARVACNGTTDYVQLVYGQGSGSTLTTTTSVTQLWVWAEDWI